MIALPEITMTALLNSLWQGMLVAGIMWAILRIMPRLNASTRYVCWYFTLAAIALLPAWHLVGPLLNEQTTNISRPPLSSDTKMAPGTVAVDYQRREITPSVKEISGESMDQAPIQAEQSPRNHFEIQLAAQP